MRPIDADALLENKFEVIDYGDPIEVVEVSDIDDAPTIEAGTVRHGEWLDSGINGTVSCSLCKFTDFFAKQNRVMLFKYCPNCGAKMEGGIPDETIHNKK